MERNELPGGWKELAAGFLQEFSDHHINKQDNFGRTALHYAAMANKTELMDFLKTNKAADDTVRDNFEKTANEYENISCCCNKNIIALRSIDTSSLVASDFHSMSLYI